MKPQLAETPGAKDCFYSSTLLWLLGRNILGREMSILVVCGSSPDKEVLHDLGFKNVTISNLDVRLKGVEFDPYQWSYQDAERLTFQDAAFDFCVAHNGLHHCYSPHRALLEMYRVARSGILVFEPRDSVVARIGIRLNFGQEFEVHAVAANELAFGGVKNTSMPNFVYRWTEREVEKTIRSFAPWGRHRFIYRYALRIPWGRLTMMKNKGLLVLVRAFLPALRFFFALFPKQANGFAFVVLKPRVPLDLHPWMRFDGTSLALNEEWIRARYGQL